MAEVNESLTRKVAELSRLHLTDAEVKLYTTQLGQILKHVEQLEKVNVSGVMPLMNPLEMATPFRDDVVKSFTPEGEEQPKVLKSAPDVMYDGYKVPPIL